MLTRLVIGAFLLLVLWAGAVFGLLGLIAELGWFTIPVLIVGGLVGFLVMIKLK